MSRDNWIEQDFPNLRSKPYEITSPPTPQYNCIAWAADDEKRWWWPDKERIAKSSHVYWPSGAVCEETLSSFIQAYSLIGYEPCTSGVYEENYEKIAIFVDKEGVPTHASRQISEDMWSSKLGRGYDISHSLDGVEGDVYGSVAQYMKRKRNLPEDRDSL